MSALAEALAAVRDFFEAGGWVLWAIFAATVLMWTLIFERLWYFAFALRQDVHSASREWFDRADMTSWHARRIRDQLISQVSLEANRALPFIRALMAVLPLLGLLGTVWGMINVFEVMSVTGTGNARAMAGGVYKATLPTMSGLVAALSGLYPSTYLERKARIEVEKTQELLAH